MRHTPGPWKVEKELCSRAGIWLISMDFRDGGRGSAIARTCGETFNDPIADARLIAAAPDLLEALETMERLAGTPMMMDDPARVAAQKAIRKAMGEE